MLDLLVAIQGSLRAALSERMAAFAQTRDLALLTSMLPLGVVFGAVHALTPGHGKTVLVSYLVSSRLVFLRGLLVSGALTLTHVGSAVVLALVGAPLLSRAFGLFGRAPAFEWTSHVLLLGLGLWLLVRAIRGRTHRHDQRDGLLVGVAAGLVPCPLTLFAMVAALARGVPEAGLAFAVAMLGGVGLTLGIVAVAALAAGRWLQVRIADPGRGLATAERALDGASGTLLAALALYGMHGS
jgi:nickel/cobalt transporter (NicO) family protein